MKMQGSRSNNTAIDLEETTSTAVAHEASSSSAIAVAGRTQRQEANQATRARPGSDRAHKVSTTSLQQVDDGAAAT